MKAVNKFVAGRKALLAMTPEEHEEDMEVEGRFIDVDQERVYLAMNINAWVRSAHDALDVFNDCDRDMLGRIADYAKWCRIIACSAPLFTTQNIEATFNSVFLTRDICWKTYL